MLFDSINFNDKLFDCETALSKGTVFSNEYKPYKNYKESKLIANSQKDELMLFIYKYDFYINDLSLFLDLHPTDDNMYRLFKENVNKLKQYVNKYESLYGPLELCHDEYDSYLWYKGNFPFGGNNV